MKTLVSRHRTKPARRLAGVVALMLAALVLGTPHVAGAHLALAGVSLLALVSQADGIVLARAASATSEASPGASRAVTPNASVAGLARLPERWYATRFEAIETLAGEGLRGSFVLHAPGPALRYPAGQIAIVLVRRGDDQHWDTGWVSPQVAGAGLTVANADEGRQARNALQAAFAATRSKAGGAPDRGAAARALALALSAEPPKLRYLATLDLYSLAHHREEFPTEVVRSIELYGASPGDDRALRPALDATLAVIRRGR